MTGAARGIGRAVAASFAAEGATVYALDRLGAELPEPANGLRPRVLDLRDAGAVGACFNEIEAEAGRIDVLVNNAGVIFYKPIEETAVEDWDDLMAVNLRAPFLCTRAAAAGMKARRSGSILNLSSNAGVRGGND
ncbi:MAG: SDR family oxidoreductase, partial [Pseudomonadota bacterium]